MPTTVRDVITTGLSTVGVIGTGEVASAAMIATGLARLQDLFDAWRADSLMIYTVTRVTKALVSGTQTYSIGSGGDIDIVWPEYLDAAAVTIPGSNPVQEKSIHIFTDQEYQGIAIKTLGGWPWGVYYDRTYGATARGVISPYPVPNLAGMTLVLYVPTAMVEPADADTVISQPPGSRRAFRLVIASELADEFGAVGEVVNRVHAKAVQALAVLKHANFRPKEMRGNPMMVGDVKGGVWDWFSGSVSGKPL